MRKFILIVFLLIKFHSFGQPLKYLMFDFGYETNFSISSLGAGVNFNFKKELFNKTKLISIGGGGEYRFTDVFLYDVRVLFSIKEGYVCHWYWEELFPTFFITGHYKFSNKFERQYIIPEFGYNFYTNSSFYLTPSISYYINLKSKESFKKSIYLAFKIKMLLIVRRNLHKK